MADRIPVSGLIGPIYSGDTYPVIDPIYGIDGLRNVDTLTDMYNIPLERRRAGMLVGVNGTTYYKLKAGPWTGSSTDWELFSSGGGGTGSGSSILYEVTSPITNTTNTLYLVYGDLEIATGGSFSNAGKVVIINGGLTFSGSGTYSGNSPELITLPRKFSATFSMSPNTGLSFSHSLNTQDVMVSVRDGYNFVYPNIELESSNPLNVVSIFCIIITACLLFSQALS
jgi:hypothetical protein